MLRQGYGRRRLLLRVAAGLIVILGIWWYFSGD